MVERDPSTDLLYVNDELVICLVVARCRTALNGEHRWRICFDWKRLFDLAPEKRTP